ncbi:MAG TPA: hypothetical protein VKV80_12545 [Streptosporangiaceae bacterium]|nr:hypothetical protein [Streptosporangiaceae bacterium]
MGVAVALLASLGLTTTAASPPNQAQPARSARHGGHSDGSSSGQPVLPSWAIGPFTRYASPGTVPYQGNPIISPQGTGWQGRATYNPGVVYHDGKFQMLYRGQSSYLGLSQFGYAYSTDGHHFTEYSGNPVITNGVPNGGAGAEDPRLYQLNGKYYTFFTGDAGANSQGVFSIAIDEAVSTDMVHWTQLGVVEHNNKDAAVVANPDGVPVKINGRYVMYYGQNGNGTYIAYSTDMVHWTTGVPVDLQLPATYAPYEMCVTVTDYPTVAGGQLNRNIDMFIAGTLMAHGRWYYAISELEFSRADLTREIGQLTFPILRPVTSYELLGQTQRTVFMNTIIFHDGRWWMYYGAGDTVIALANAPLRSRDSVRAYDDFTGTSFEPGQRQPDWADAVDTSPGGGGEQGVGAEPGSGLTGPGASTAQVLGDPGGQVEAHSGDTSLVYSGDAQGKPQDYAYLKIFDLSNSPVMVHRTTALSYWIYPASSQLVSTVNGDNSSCVAIDLVFSDGSALRDLGATDRSGYPLTPQGQCGHLQLDQWNHVTAGIGTVAAGKRIVRIDVGYDSPGSSGGFQGYIDDVTLTH